MSAPVVRRQPAARCVDDLLTSVADEPSALLPSPDALRRIALPPLSLGGLHTVICDRLGQAFPRSTMVRIREMSGGNLF
jgi:hypothetical protein